ncbi:MAG: hypothetical protein HY525_07845 [Betaproteobacteria bacterium]|nr:hypothetical protein [Betaproteobacteria bacterium]
MILMIDHIYTDPATEQAWHDWYAGYQHRLLSSVPSFHSAQRFKAIGQKPSRYLSMYTIESVDFITSQGYKGMGGGGSQSARFHPAYALWTRNLFEGAERAPEIGKGQRLFVIDSPTPDKTFPRGVEPLWLRSPGPQKSIIEWQRQGAINGVNPETTPYRAVIVLDAETAQNVMANSGGYVYEPFTPLMRSK